jgi:hypothetical protein
MFRSAYGAPVLIEDAPTIEFRNGLFYVCIDSAGLCLAYTPSVFFEAIGAAVAESRKYPIGRSAKIIPVDFVGHHGQAASASGSPSK